MKFQTTMLIVGIVAIAIIAAVTFSPSDAQAEESLYLGTNEMQNLIGMACGGGSSTPAGEACYIAANNECSCSVIDVIIPIFDDNCHFKKGPCSPKNNTACTGGTRGNCSAPYVDCGGTRTYQTCSFHPGWCIIFFCQKSDETTLNCTGGRRVAGSAC